MIKVELGGKNPHNSSSPEMREKIVAQLPDWIKTGTDGLYELVTIEEIILPSGKKIIMDSHYGRDYISEIVDLSPEEIKSMTDITEEIQSERAQIRAQERELIIKKIQLAIKELYAAFEDGNPIRNDNATLRAIEERLSQSVVLSQQFPKAFPIDPRSSKKFPDYQDQIKVPDFSQGGQIPAYSESVDGNGFPYAIEMSDD